MVDSKHQYEKWCDQTIKSYAQSFRLAFIGCPNAAYVYSIKYICLFFNTTMLYVLVLIASFVFPDRSRFWSLWSWYRTVRTCWGRCTRSFSAYSSSPIYLGDSTYGGCGVCCSSRWPSSCLRSISLPSAYLRVSATVSQSEHLSVAPLSFSCLSPGLLSNRVSVGRYKRHYETSRHLAVPSQLPAAARRPPPPW